jgi:NNP family nitrate/nitrite transporter-like MFS transporter
VGALGGVLVNLAFRQSLLSTGAGNVAYIVFIACLLLTWVVYVRPAVNEPGRTLAGCP